MRRRIWLFLRIVWRIDMSESRMSARTAWDVVCTIHPPRTSNRFAVQQVELARLRRLLYDAIVELSYIQDVELPGDHSLCRTSRGEEIIERGMKLLRVNDLSAEKLGRKNRN